jgi:hypothetical protein
MFCTEVTPDVAGMPHVTGIDAAAPAVVLPYCFPPSDVVFDSALPRGLELASGEEWEYGELTVLGVLRRYVPRYFDLREPLTADQLLVLERILNCRTRAMGAYVWRCRWCGHRHITYNACRNRHCPGCGPLRRDEWLAQVLSWSLPLPTSYLHIVITQPPLLEPLLLANPALLYRLLFDSAQQAIAGIARDVYHALPGWAAMLHSWGQPMDIHAHCHIIETAGGLALDGSGWVAMSPDDEAFSKESLGGRFRDLYLAGLLKLFRKGQLTLPAALAWIRSEEDFRRWLEPIATIQWHAHCQGPPPGCEGPVAALSYLARYVGGSVISDHRILGDDGQTVTIREKNYREGGIYETLELTGVEFVRRFAQHILPRGMHRVRYGGLFSPQKRKERLELAARILREQNPEAFASRQVVVQQQQRPQQAEWQGALETTPLGVTDHAGLPDQQEQPPRQEIDDQQLQLQGLDAEEDHRPVCRRCEMPGMEGVGHLTAKKLAIFLFQLKMFWYSATRVLVTLPFQRRGPRHGPDPLGDVRQRLCWTMTTIDVNVAVSYCDAPPPDT